MERAQGGGVMGGTDRPAGRAGRPAPQWLRALATGLVDKVQSRGMTLTVEAAEQIVAERITALATTLRITERSARTYIDHDALDGMADSLAEFFADEAPGADLLTLPRNSGLRAPGIGRLVAALAQCALFFESYEGVDQALSRSRGHEIMELVSMLGLIQAGQGTGDVIHAPRALFVRVSRILKSVAGLTSDPDLSLALQGDALIADAGSKAHRRSPWPAEVIEMPGRTNPDVNILEWNPADVESRLCEYPWVVWDLTLNDPNRLAGEDVADRTKETAEKVADLYGCDYEYCVDDDEYADGTKYYRWLIAVKQSEHRTPVRSLPRPVSDVPQVVGELYAKLCTILPAELRGEDLWEVCPDLYATHVRNAEDSG